MINSKKAQTYETLMWAIPRFLFLIVVSLTILLLLRAFIVTNISIQPAEALLFINSALYGPGGFSYYDTEINRLYPGVVDQDNFNSARTKNGINYGVDRALAAEFRIGSGTANYNEAWFNRWIPIAKAGLKGPGSIFILLKRADTVTSQNQRITINATVLVPKS